MTEPKLRVAASGAGGSGYKIPTWLENGKPATVIGVTTALNASAKPAVAQWVADTTAAYAVANIDALLSRDETQGWGFLRWFHKRRPNLEDDDIRNHHVGVLDDLADLGTRLHEWIEAHVTGEFEPAITQDHEAQAISAFLEWYGGHTVEVILNEATVVNYEKRYAGTLDGLWRVSCKHDDPCVEGTKVLLVDIKSSRGIWPDHKRQIAALGAGYDVLTEVVEGTPGAFLYETKKWGKTWWVSEPMPAFDGYAFLHVRPDDWDVSGNPIPAYCELDIVDPEEVALEYEAFLGCLMIKESERKVRQYKKEEK